MSDPKPQSLLIQSIYFARTMLNRCKCTEDYRVEEIYCLMACAGAKKTLFLTSVELNCDKPSTNKQKQNKTKKLQS